MAQRRTGGTRSRSNGDDTATTAAESPSRPRRLRRKANDSVVDEEEDVNTANRNDNEEEDEEDAPEGNEVMEDYDEEEEDEGADEITRCICGHQEVPTQTIKNSKVPVDAGLFIQCEYCQVWQHGFCVGFMNEEDVPDVYGCEKCRPERHLVVVRPAGKTSTYYPDGAPDAMQGEAPVQKTESATKKRPESKSRGGSATPASGGGTSKRGEKKATQKSSAPSSPPVSDKDTAVSASTLRERRRETMNSRDAAYEETLKRVLEESAHDLGQRPKEEQEEGEEQFQFDVYGESNDTPSKEKKRKSPDSDDRAATAAAATKRARRTPKSRKTSDEDTMAQTPVPEEGKTANTSLNTASTASPSKRKRTKPKKTGNNAKESKPPQPQITAAKPRIPPPRASMHELQKRVAAILEYIARSKVDADQEQLERRQLMDERNDRFQQLFPDDTVEESKFTALFEHHEANLSKIDTLTQRLVQWEQLYGSFDPTTED